LVAALSLPAAPAMAGSQRVEALLAAMTLPEKVALMHGAEDPLTEIGSPSQRGAGYVPGVPRLGIPPLRLTDGPAGIRTARLATTLPAPVALAASFDPELARRFGAVLGSEARAANQDVVLAPMVNIVRTPLAGRNFETLGEDPYLAARIAESEVRGIQGAGAIATVKHLAANNQEDHREAVDARVDDRALHEIYLPAFAASVRAGSEAAMCGYNAVNGTPACENWPLLDGVLRGELGFAGWVMSDWGATHTTLPSLEAGLDMEMWSGARYGSLSALVPDPVPVARIDASVRRILGAMDRTGLLHSDRPRPEPDLAAHAATAREVAIAGTVLLRNEGDVPPLGPDDLSSLAVIGPAAILPVVGGGGSSRVAAPNAKSLLQALRSRTTLGDGPVYAVGDERDGAPVPAATLSALGMSPATIDRAIPPGTDWRWTGSLTAPLSGTYTLALQAAPLGLDPASPWRAGGTASLRLDGLEVARLGGIFGGSAGLLPTADGLANAAVRLDMVAGVSHRISVQAAAGPDGPMRLRLAWITPEQRQTAFNAAVAAAKMARTAIVVAFDEAGEGHDRPSLDLPGQQDALIEAVVRANPRTIVVVAAGAPVLMPWLPRAAAVLETWYPGVEGAAALEAVLLGEADPGGRLPVTFPSDPALTPTSPPERYPGVGEVATYSEGVLVGYRWYDATGTEPLFPFGHGLSYTRFAYSDLAMTEDSDGVTVGFTIRNTGNRPGSEVPQLYLGEPDPAAVPMPPRQLKGFAKVDLAQGEERRIELRLDRQAMSFWSTGRRAWTAIPGAVRVEIGASSRDIRLTGWINTSIERLNADRSRAINIP
jgi:beta-glucosidase